MGQFQVRYEIQPAGAFGVPEPRADRVSPVGRTITTRAVHVFQDEHTSWGSMPLYRDDDEAIRQTVALPTSTIRFEDNYVLVHVAAASILEAQIKATEELDRYLMHLTCLSRQFFTHRCFSVESNGNIAAPRGTGTSTVTHVYDLPKLRKNLQEAASASTIRDSRYLRATKYRNHAILLLDLIRYRTHSAQERLHLATGVFLNLWKAVATIVGDPSSDKHHQTRHRELGLPKRYYQRRIKPLHDVRNKWDVAHPSLDETLLAELDPEVGTAFDVCDEVMAAYRASLSKS